MIVNRGFDIGGWICWVWIRGGLLRIELKIGWDYVCVVGCDGVRSCYYDCCVEIFVGE